MQAELRCFALQQKLSLTETRRDAEAARTLRVIVVVVLVVGIIVSVFTLPL